MLPFLMVMMKLFNPYTSQITTFITLHFVFSLKHPDTVGTPDGTSNSDSNSSYLFNQLLQHFVKTCVLFYFVGHLPSSCQTTVTGLHIAELSLE